MGIVLFTKFTVPPMTGEAPGPRLAAVLEYRVNMVSRSGPEIGELSSTGTILHISGILGSDQLHTGE